MISVKKFQVIDNVSSVQYTEILDRAILKSLDKLVIPTKAGIQVSLFLDSRMRGNDGCFRVIDYSVLDISEIMRRFTNVITGQQVASVNEQFAEPGKA